MCTAELCIIKLLVVHVIRWILAHQLLVLRIPVMHDGVTQYKICNYTIDYSLYVYTRV